MCDELQQANKIIKKLHDSNQEQTQKVIVFFVKASFIFAVSYK